jgi:hypothetical protein
MKYLPHTLSVLALIVVLGYIHFNESRSSANLSDSSNYFDRDNPPGGAASPYLNAVSLELPEKMTFAGEPVPLDIPDVRERLDRELHINTYWHSSTIFLIKRANRWIPQIEKILKDNGIPEDFKYLTAIESGFSNVVSPKNAVGFWQILSTSGKENGLEINKYVDERYDPIKSTEAACKYLKKAYGKFGSWTSAAASYNRGMRGLQNAMDDQEENSYYDLLLNEETSRYVFRILAAREIIEHPEKYGFDINNDHLYESEPMRFVEVNEDIDDLVAFAKEQGVNYKLLKRHNPWLRKHSLKVKSNKTYQIAIPDKTLQARP